MGASGVKHGTPAAYTVRGCRCDACRAAHTAYQADYRSRKVRGRLLLGAVVDAVETWRQLRLLKTEYFTEAALAARFGLKDRRLRYGRRIRVRTMLKVKQLYQLDILDGIGHPNA